MIQLTRRDEQMLDWLDVVRLADMDGVRWALAGLKQGYAERPVTIRRANQWIARMADAGFVDRVRPMYRDRQIIWPTHRASGRSAPKLFRQTMRHELAVAAVAARYLARGYRWARDAGFRHGRANEADGIATNGSAMDIVEVELTVKKLSRYRQIYSQQGQRLAADPGARVVYFCALDVVGAVRSEADKFIFREQRDRHIALPTFDGQGKWVGTSDWPSELA